MKPHRILPALVGCIWLSTTSHAQMPQAAVMAFEDYAFCALSMAEVKTNLGRFVTEIVEISLDACFNHTGRIMEGVSCNMTPERGWEKAQNRVGKAIIRTAVMARTAVRMRRKARRRTG